MSKPVFDLFDPRYFTQCDEVFAAAEFARQESHLGAQVADLEERLAFVTGRLVETFGGLARSLAQSSDPEAREIASCLKSALDEFEGAA
jgi:hypothetical protein